MNAQLYECVICMRGGGVGKFRVVYIGDFVLMFCHSNCVEVVVSWSLCNSVARVLIVDTVVANSCTGLICVEIVGQPLKPA